jgi:uncharacterized membrane protein YoaK (UPF0700 family)
VATAVTHVHAGKLLAGGLIATLALAMGIRNACVRRIGVPDLSTTVLTMTLTGLAADAPGFGGSGHGAARRLLAVVAMLGGALVGALLVQARIWLALGTATALALATLLLYREAPQPTVNGSGRVTAWRNGQSP